MNRFIHVRPELRFNDYERDRVTSPGQLSIAYRPYRDPTERALVRAQPRLSYSPDRERPRPAVRADSQLAADSGRSQPDVGGNSVSVHFIAVFGRPRSATRQKLLA